MGVAVWVGVGVSVGVGVLVAVGVAVWVGVGVSVGVGVLVAVGVAVWVGVGVSVGVGVLVAVGVGLAKLPIPTSPPPPQAVSKVHMAVEIIPQPHAVRRVNDEYGFMVFSLKLFCKTAYCKCLQYLVYWILMPCSYAIPNQHQL